MELQSLFSVPLFKSRLDDPGFNAALAVFLLALEHTRADEIRNPVPNMRIQEHVFESDFRLFGMQNALIARLAQYCTRSLWRAVYSVNQISEQDFAKLDMKIDAWFHITRRTGYHALHNHPMASWSGVYCVDPGDSGLHNSDSGALAFVNPMAFANMFLDSTNSQLKEPYAMSGAAIRFAQGDLVIFPSWLWHQAMTYLGQTPRVTVAFNAWFQTRRA